MEDANMTALIRHVALVSDSPSISFGQLSTAAAAINKQVVRDFGPLWGIEATVDAFDKLESVPVDYWPVILADDINQPGAAGYHTDDNGQPFSLVQVDDSWSLTCSHETLEMLADPFGNRTVAGDPPPQAPSPISNLQRVVYLVETCDPPEGAEFGYHVNGVLVSDFITPHYYDPTGATGVQFSFRNHIKGPHEVLEGGYVSFGNPVDNHWYQIVVQDSQVSVNDLGILNARGKSLRETIDHATRVTRSMDAYYKKSGEKPKVAAAKAGAAAVTAVTIPLAASSEARAKSLREFAKTLK
jgi:hypothetical protein